MPRPPDETFIPFCPTLRIHRERPAASSPPKHWADHRMVCSPSSLSWRHSVAHATSQTSGHGGKRQFNIGAKAINSPFRAKFKSTLSQLLPEEHHTVHSPPSSSLCFGANRNQDDYTPFPCRDPQRKGLDLGPSGPWYKLESLLLHRAAARKC